MGSALAQGRRYAWQPYELPPQGKVTLNHSVEYLPTNIYLALRKRRRDSWEKHSTKLEPAKSCSKHFVKNCQLATAYTSHKVPLLRASGPPLDITGKTADQHWFKVNFA